MITELAIPFENIALTPPTQHPGSNIRLITFTGFSSERGTDPAEPLKEAIKNCCKKINSEVRRCKTGKIHIISTAQSVYSAPTHEIPSVKTLAQFSVTALVW